MSKLPENRVRIPVRLVDGRWEYFYGEKLPISEGTVAELVVDRLHVTDSDFLAQLKKKSSYKIMGQGTRIMVSLTIKENSKINKELSRHLKKIPMNNISSEKKFTRFGVREDTRFVEIINPKAGGYQRRRGRNLVGA